METTIGLPILTGLIAVALLFDFLNGLHDAANSIATIVSTRVLRPQYAVFWAAFGSRGISPIPWSVSRARVARRRFACR